MAIIRRRNSIRAQSSTVTGAVIVGQGLISGSGSIAARNATVSGTVTVTPAAVTYTPPSWNTLPTFTFINGTASSQSIAPYFTEGSYATSTISAQNLPTGVTYDGATKTLVYDGAGAVATASNVTLTASDGYGDAVDITTLLVREASGTAGMYFAKGDIPTGRYVSCSTAGVQAVVKNRWQDGSVKFAVISWAGLSASSGAPLSLTISTSATDMSAGTAISLASFRARGITGIVQFTAGTGWPNHSVGATPFVTLAGLIGDTPFRQWLAGPQCSEWHWRIPVDTDPNLVVWLYARAYADGTTWLRVIVENGYSFIAQAGRKYHCRIDINGTQRYNTQTDVSLTFPDAPQVENVPWWKPWVTGDHLPHSSRTRWTKEFWYTPRSIEVPAHDPAYLMGTKLFPHYPQYTTTYPSSWPLDSVPLALGSQRADQNQGGYNSYIGFINWWDAFYLASPYGSLTQQKAAKTSIANAIAHGAYSQVYRDESSAAHPNLPILPSAYPRIWTSSGGSPILGTITDRSPYKLDIAHQPNYSFMAYAITGDYYHLETMQFTASNNYVVSPYDKREGATGLFWAVQTRYFAWAMRTLAHAACMTPDSLDANSYEYKFTTWAKQALAANVTRNLATHVDGNLTGTNPISGVSLAPYNNAKNTLGFIVNNILHGVDNGYSIGVADSSQNAVPPANYYFGDAPWQQHFCGQVLTHLQDMDLLTGGDATNLNRLMLFSLSHPVALLGTTGWPYPWAGIYSAPYFRRLWNGSAYATAETAADWSTCYTWKLAALQDLGRTFPNLIPGLPATGAPMFYSGYYYNTDFGNIQNGYAVIDVVEWSRSIWANLQPAISCAVDKQVPGAQAAYDRMRSMAGVSPNNLDASWATHEAQFNATNFHWAVTPRGQP